MGKWDKKLLSTYMEIGLIELGRGNVISKIDIEKKPGDFPIYSSSALHNGKFGEYGKYMFDEELVSWSVDGGGYFFFRPKHKYSITNVSGYLRVKGKCFEPKFLFYLLSEQHKSLTFDYTTKAHPSVIKKLYWIPSIPLSHQQKIAAILTAIDTAIEKTESLIDKYRKIKTGLMNDLFTRGIGVDGKLRPPRSQAPELYKKTELGWIPNEWEVVTIGKCGDVFNGSTPSRQNKSFWGGEIPWISSGKINDYVISSPSEYVTIKALDSTAIKIVPKDSVLVGLIGQGRTRGMVAKLSIESTINQNLGAIVPFKGYNGDFIHQYLFREYHRLRNVGRGSNQSALNCQILRDFIIEIPKQGKEQEIVSKTLLVIDDKIYKEHKIIKKLQKQKAGLMQDLLTGKVEVTVPEEETVDV